MAVRFIKRSVFAFLALLILWCFSVVVLADNRNVTVYIAGGSSSAYRYHNSSSCYHLSRSNPSAVTLEWAASHGYTACTHCNPPRPDFPVDATPRPETESFSGSGAGSGRGSNRTSKDNTLVPSIIVVTITALIFLVPLAIHSGKEGKERKEYKRQEEERARLQEEEYQRDRAHYLQLYQGKDVLQLAEAPEGCYVGQDSLPARWDGTGFWGSDYTFYITPFGHTFHRRNCKVLSGCFDVKAVNAFKLLQEHDQYRVRYYSMRKSARSLRN